MEKVKSSARYLFFLVFSAFILFSLGYHIYLAHYFTYGWKNHPILWLSIFVIGFTSTILAYFVAHSRFYKKLVFITWLGYIWLGFFFILAAFTIPFQIVSVIWLELDTLRTEWFFSLIALATYSLYRGLEHPQLKNHQIKVENENLKGLRLVQITDLHLGQLQHDSRWFKKVIEDCNSQKPDFLFLTGDLVETSFKQIQDELNLLTQLEAKIDRIFVLGNHEMIHGGADWENVLKGLHWTVLHNEHKIYSIKGSQLQVAGVPDRMINRFDSQYESNPEKSMQTLSKVDYRLLLAHEPSSVKDVKNIKPDIILSGHTHAGQIFPFNWLVHLVQPVVVGWKTINGVLVFAHPGTGLWGPPMRLGSRNQIVVIDFI
ncbi:MAG: metallophosphoesterase [Bdellovibrionales bacterium]